jgi:hypothetical protein
VEPKKPVDWESIEKDWRAGIKTKLQISQEYGISRAAMDKRFKKLGVDRDLTEKIQQRAQALVTQQMVTQTVTAGTNVTTPRESEIIEVNAQVQANAIFSHRKDINRYRNLITKLLNEIEVETDNPEPFAELAEVIIWKSADGDVVQTKEEINRMNRMQQLFDRVMSNPARVDSMKKLSDTLKTLIGLERQALGLKEEQMPTAPNGEARQRSEFYE